LSFIQSESLEFNKSDGSSYQTIIPVYRLIQIFSL